MLCIIHLGIWQRLVDIQPDQRIPFLVENGHVFKILFRKYPRLTFTVDEIIEEGEQACALWSNEGEDQKENPYKNRGVTIVKVANEKIVFISDYFKDTSFTE